MLFLLATCFCFSLPFLPPTTSSPPFLPYLISSCLIIFVPYIYIYIFTIYSNADVFLYILGSDGSLVKYNSTKQSNEPSNHTHLTKTIVVQFETLDLSHPSALLTQNSSYVVVTAVAAGKPVLMLWDTIYNTLQYHTSFAESIGRPVEVC